VARLEIDSRLGNLPQFRGAVKAAFLGEPLSIVEAGISASKLVGYEAVSGQLPAAAPGKSRESRLDLDKIAQRMLKAGRSPQQIGEVMARLLPTVGQKNKSPKRR